MTNNIVSGGYPNVPRKGGGSLELVRKAGEGMEKLDPDVLGGGGWGKGVHLGTFR